MRAGARAGALLWLVLPFVVVAPGPACSPTNNGTVLIVHVTTDLAVPSALNRIEIQVNPERGGQSVDSFTIDSSAALPATLAIRPSGSPSFNIDVTARGMLGGSSVVSQTATVPFFPGEARELTLFLSRDCAMPMPCATAGQVCLAGGTCVSKTQVAQPQPYVADAGRDGPRDGGGGGLDTRGRDARDNPAQWAAVSPAFPSPTATLNGVWPIDNATVWVVGYVQPRGLAARFAQGQWTDTPLPSGTATLYGVWAANASNVWAVGVAGTVLRYDGNVWAPVSVSGGPAPTQTLSGVWGTPTGSDIWIVGGGGTVLHGSSDGSLMVETSNTTAELTGVWGAGGEVWAVGARGTVIRRSSAGQWAPQTHGLTQNVLYSVWSSGRTDVWAAGDRVTLHYDGASWIAVPNPLEITISLWGSADDDVWAVGRPVSATGASFISRFNGVEWVAATSPANTTLQSVRGSSFGNVWAVGNAGVVMHLQ
jgi:hypothetical protein